MNQTRPPARQRGLTLIELILAITITAVIGVAVIAMLNAADYGTHSSRDLRELVVRGKTLTDRINQAIRYAEAVLEVDDHHLLLRSRTNTDGEATYLLLRHDAEADELLAYRDTRPADSDEPTVDQLAQTLTPRPWASGVRAWAIEADDAESQAPLISYRLTLTVRGSQPIDDALAQTVIGAATPRNR